MIKNIVTVLILIFTLNSCADKSDTVEQIPTLADEIQLELIEIRRNINAHAELSKHETRTSEIVSNYLLNLGLEVHKNIGGYGVVGILNGNKNGKKIAWRADMDAVKTIITDSISQSERVTAIHKCGHDVHTAIGLGIANVLSQIKDDIDGTVYFVFQPAEETFTGAKAMIDDGLFEKIKPNEIYGLHVFPTQLGTISVKPNELFAYEKTLSISFSKAIDSTKSKSFLDQELKKLIRHKANRKPWSLDQITDAEFGLGNKNTIYNDYFILTPLVTNTQDQKVTYTSTFFETDKERINGYLQTIKNSILNSEFKDIFKSITYSRGNPTVINDLVLTESAINKLSNRFPDNAVQPIFGQVPYFNEDFIYFQQKVPGVLFFLGASNEEKGIFAMPHSDNFAVDEDVINYGVKYFSSFLVDSVND